MLTGRDSMSPDGAPGRQRRQWLAAGVAVLVAISGAVAVVAVRNARQTGGATTPGSPPARSGAAMAFDSTAGLTIMFGGTSTSGAILGDTWQWDGAGWSAVTSVSGPGALLDPRMSDDPADGGVLLAGAPKMQISPDPSCAIVGSGSIGYGTGSAGVAGRATATTAPTPPSTSVPPVAGSHPGIGALPGAGAENPVRPCGTPALAAAMQTWLFTSRGWSRADAAGSSPAAPPPGAQVGYDAASRLVVAVSLSRSTCAWALASGADMHAQVMGPLLGAPASIGGSASTVPPTSPIVTCDPATPCPVPQLPCRPATASVASTCGGSGTIVQTWTWSVGHWTSRDHFSAPADVVDEHLTADTRGGLVLVAERVPPSAPCVHPALGCTPTVPAMAAWTWHGTAWQPGAGGLSGAGGPLLAGAQVAEAGDTLVALTAAGQTWAWDGSAWHRKAGGPGPGGRRGAALAAAPGNSVVLFGGTTDATSSPAGMLVAPGPPGGDTWVWNQTAWRNIGGPAPGTPASVPSCPPGVKIECAGPPATGVPFGAPPTVPASAPAHTPLGALPPSPSPG